MTAATVEEQGHDAVGLDTPHTEPATHTVLTRLRERIVTGEIAPDARLRAEALATEMNVSRTPIRSALAVLSAEGLVSYSVNRGYTVRAMSLGDIFDSIDTRAALEGLGARTSVDLGWSKEALGNLSRLSAAGRAVTDAGRWSEAIELEWYTINRQFHAQILHAAQNTVLRNAIRMTLVYPLFGDAARLCPTVAVCVPPRLRQVPVTPPDHILQSQDDHEKILAAIRAEDSLEAGRLMSDHVLATRTRLHAAAIRR
ncbi:GntR family transcriptional regulator [Caulobacter soli]|uniref:GntR family transcriptional regulator n=1 Tax=Caulobacter soli TaxID=2708539 RepID=UPI0013EA2C4E|nr:GntR family transcriptional regulator [Caulobacter soli]